MTAPFDPYHRWLGIPPRDQPPDHYRLLGVDRFESDLDVIRDGADRQMTHVRTYQLGAYSALSQTILNELAAARVCLLNPNKKAAYDRNLRQQLAAEPMAEGLDEASGFTDAAHADHFTTDGDGFADFSVQSLDPAILAGFPAEPSAPTGGSLPQRPPANTFEKQSTERWIVGAAIGAAILVVIGVGIMLMWRSGSRGSPEPHIAKEEKEDPQAKAPQTQEPTEEQEPTEPAKPPPPPGLSDSSEPPPPTPPTDDEDHEWLNATTETANVGSLEVQVASVEFDTTAGTPGEERLIVRIRLTNTDANSTPRHTGWGSSAQPTNRASMRDSRNNSYEPGSVPGRTIEGRVRIQQGEPLHDVLVFNRPPEPFEYLRLVLPTNPLGEKGFIRFEIPPTMLEQGGPPKVVVPGGVPKGPGFKVPVPPPAVRYPLPAAGERERIGHKLDKRFGRPEKARERSELLGELLDLLEDSECGNERFMILCRASELASEVGEIVRMAELVDRIADEFEVDRLRVHAHRLRILAQQVANGKQRATKAHLRALLDASSYVYDESLRTDQLSLAAQLGAAVRSACEAAGEFEEEASEFLEDVQETHAWWKNVLAARDKLESNPEDENALTTVGRWYSHVQGDWAKALPRFAKGSDPELRKLAEQDLKHPEDPAAQVELANAWWKLAHADGEEPDAVWAARAAYWYEQAWPGLKSALLKKEVQDRLSELGHPDPDGPRHDPLPTRQWRLSELLEEGGEPAPDHGKPGQADRPGRANDRQCRRCKGTGKVRVPCKNRMCAGGRVRRHWHEPVSRCPHTGRVVTHRVAIRVPCPVCGGRGPQVQPCPECGGREQR